MTDPFLSVRSATRTLLAAIAALLVLSLAAAAAAQAPGWEEVRRDKGVTVWQKERPDLGMPIFRGRTVIDANVYVLLAILADFDNHCQWMHGCHTAKLLKGYDDFHRVSYNRTDAPWPVDDRDVVLDSRVEVKAARHTVLIRFKSITSALQPEVDGVVRMTKLQGYYKLVALSPTRTTVEYQVDTDPGGYLPDWVVARASQDLPVNTLTNLRKRAGLVDGQYKDFIARWDPAHNPEAPQVVPEPKEEVATDQGP